MVEQDDAGALVYPAGLGTITPITPVAPAGEPPAAEPAPRAISRQQRRELERFTELAECEAKLKALLQEYNAALDVVTTIIYKSGQPFYTHTARVISL